MPPARLEARMDSLFSFPVGLFRPLQHAGLSRRTPVDRQERPSGNIDVDRQCEGAYTASVAKEQRGLAVVGAPSQRMGQRQSWNLDRPCNHPIEQPLAEYPSEKRGDRGV